MQLVSQMLLDTPQLRRLIVVILMCLQLVIVFHDHLIEMYLQPNLNIHSRMLFYEFVFLQLLVFL